MCRRCNSNTCTCKISVTVNHDTDSDTNKLGIENLNLGFGDTKVLRGNKLVKVTRINASHIPYNEESSIEDILNNFGTLLGNESTDTNVRSTRNLGDWDNLQLIGKGAITLHVGDIVKNGVDTYIVKRDSTRREPTATSDDFISLDSLFNVTRVVTTDDGDGGFTAKTTEIDGLDGVAYVLEDAQGNVVGGIRIAEDGTLFNVKDNSPIVNGTNGVDGLDGTDGTDGTDGITVDKATQEQVDAGTDDNTYVTPKALHDKSSSDTGIHYTAVAMNTNPVGKIVATNVYLPATTFTGGDISTDNSGRHEVVIPYAAKLENSTLEVFGSRSQYLQGKAIANGDRIDWWINHELKVNSFTKNTGSDTKWGLHVVDRDYTVREHFSVPFHYNYNGFSKKGKAVEIILKSRIEYLNKMSADTYRVCDSRDKMVVREVENLPTQVTTSTVGNLALGDTANENVTVVSWNVAYHSKATIAEVGSKIASVTPDNGGMVVVGLQEAIGNATFEGIFGEKGKDWFWLEANEYDQVWSDASAIAPVNGREMFTCTRGIASNVPFTDIKYINLDPTADDYRNQKVAVAGKVRGTWFVMIHSASLSSTAVLQLNALKNVIETELGNPDKLVLFGDFNLTTDELDATGVTTTMGLVASTPNVPTNCANTNKIDHIFSRGITVGVGEIVDACSLSDHRLSTSKFTISK